MGAVDWGTQWRLLEWHYLQPLIWKMYHVRAGRDHRDDLVHYFMDWDAETDKEGNSFKVKGEFPNSWTPEKDNWGRWGIRFGKRMKTNPEKAAWRWQMSRRGQTCLAVGMACIMWIKEEGRDKEKWGREREKLRKSSDVLSMQSFHRFKLNKKLRVGELEIIGWQYQNLSVLQIQIPWPPRTRSLPFPHPPYDSYTSKVLNSCCSSFNKDSISPLLAYFPEKASSPLAAWAGLSASLWMPPGTGSSFSLFAYMLPWGKWSSCTEGEDATGVESRCATPEGS